MSEIVNEPQLVIALRESDEKAFEQIYHHYCPLLYSVAYNHVRDQQVAEELVQDLFVALWVKREQVAIHTSLKGYLLTSLRHRVYDHIDKERVRRQTVEQFMMRNELISHITEQTLAYQELETQLHQAVDRLPSSTQSVFRLSRFQYMTPPDIAQRLGLSPKMVEYHLTKALKLLKNYLKL